MTAAHCFALRPPIQRILVIPSRAVGDVLLATPALRALRAGFPAAEVHVGLDEGLVPLLARNPHVDRLWPFPRRRAARGRWWRLYRDLPRQRFDLVIDLLGSPRTALLARATRAPNRVGWQLRGRGRLYNWRVPRDTDRTGRRRLQYAAGVDLDIVARCGVVGPVLDDPSLVYVPDPAVEARMDAALPDPGRPRVGVAAAGTWQAKTWGVDGFARLADRLVEAGADVLLLWGPGERGVAEAVQGCMARPARLAPPTDLDELAALLARLDLVISNDSGVRHLATARGTATLGIFGPTSPRTWTPPTGPHAWVRVDLPCLECNRTRCLHHLCMRRLDADAVAVHAVAHLQAQGRRPPCAC
jgi:lipopolysaccharide heptosyltransferase II